MSDNSFIAINDGQNSSIALFEEGKLSFALEEEKVARKKLISGFPAEASNYLHAALTDLNKGLAVLPNRLCFSRRVLDAFSASHDDSCFSPSQMANIYYHTYFLRSCVLRGLSLGINKVLVHKYPYKKKLLFDHHDSHAFSAYGTSGFKDALVFTADGYGGLSSSKAFIFGERKKEIISSSSPYNSPGYFYSGITQILGFHPSRHPGKVTGLAAYGDPKTLYPLMSKLFYFDAKNESFSFDYRKLILINKNGALLNFKREDVAAALQQRLEDVFLEYLNDLSDKTRTKRICLAGGVFANVKLNHTIHRKTKFKNIYIFPAMSDAGLSVGAGLNYLFEEGLTDYHRLKTIYLGSGYTDMEIKNVLEKKGLKFEHLDDIEQQIAELISNDKIVARFNGRTEFGPRALGNRSIICQGTDKDINIRLNKALKRSDFMPFAPTTLVRYADKCYKDIPGAEFTSKFMNIAFEATDWMKECSPALVHVDGTSRPQLLSKEDNESYYKIVDEYRKITGIPTVLNTSFNMHEEPIVCSPEDAIESFLKARLDVLAIGNYIVKRKN